MHESAQDLAVLQGLLDRSYLSAGDHLRSIHTQGRRMSARQLTDRLEGICLLVLATVNAAGRPITSAVDAVFHRGSFYFGTDPTALRWRHLRRNPAVSATHLPSEDWAVTVHGHAVPVGLGPADPEGLRASLLEVYQPRYGERWVEFLDSGPVYARIDAARMFAIDVTAGSSALSRGGSGSQVRWPGSQHDLWIIIAGDRGCSRSVRPAAGSDTDPGPQRHRLRAFRPERDGSVRR